MHGNKTELNADFFLFFFPLLHHRLFVLKTLIIIVLISKQHIRMCVYIDLQAHFICKTWLGIDWLCSFAFFRRQLAWLLNVGAIQFNNDCRKVDIIFYCQWQSVGCHRISLTTDSKQFLSDFVNLSLRNQHANSVV